MEERKTWDVAPLAGAWSVRLAGGVHHARLFRTKEQAVAYGTTRATAARRGRLRIKRLDGTVEDERIYSRAPHPSSD